MASREKAVTFRSDNGNEDFSVVFNVSDESNKVAIVSSETEKFFKYLQKLGIIEKDTTMEDWAEKLDEIGYSDPNTSIKIRIKAHVHGLDVVPGKAFEAKRTAALKRIAKGKRRTTLG